MPRDRANINTSIWTSEEFRELPGDQQLLYFILVTHPKLSYVGVVDWREGRLAAMTADATAETVRKAAEGLQAARFVLIDDDTEEILVRSFMRHDGLLKQPKLSISMVNAYADISSKRIRQVVTFELQKLYREYPTWKAFEQEKVIALTKGKGTDIAEFTHGFTLNVGQADPLRTTTATTTATEASLPADDDAKKPAVKLPKNWAPTASHIERAREKNVDVIEQAEAFKLHAETHDRRAANWNAAFTTWLTKARPSSRQIAEGAELNVEKILGPDYWVVGMPPAGLSIQEELTWKKARRAEHEAERLEQARKKVASA